MPSKVHDSSVVYIEEENRIRNNFFISPSSLIYQLWEGFISLTCLFCTLAVTFQASFRADSTVITAIAYTFDLFYIIHIASKFFVAYFHEGGLVTDKRKIQRKYITREFIVDICSVIPAELIPLGLNYSASDWQYVIRFGKLNRIVRFYTLTKFFGKYEDQLGVRKKLIRSIKYFLIACTLIHTLSCGWYIFACPNESLTSGPLKCYAGGWAVVKEQRMEQLTLLQRYIKCLYWATITATTTGYGDIHAVTSSEKWYSIFTMLVGIGFFFGPILGYMASTLTNADAKRARYTHRIDVINEHLNDKLVSKETQKKVTGYYDHLWSHHQGVGKYNMFSELPLPFQDEISFAMNKHVLEVAPLFHNVGVDFIRMAALVIKQSTFLPKQTVFLKNDIRHTLFYVKRGILEVLSDHYDSKPVKMLREGSFFGEISLLMNIPKCATVRAVTYCELLMLDRADLVKVLKHFPEISEQLHKTIEQRCIDATQTYKRNESVPLPMSHYSMNANDVHDTDDNLVAEKFEVEERSRSITFSPSTHLFLWKIFISILTIATAFVQTYMLSYKSSFGSPGYGTSSGTKIIFALLYIIDIAHLVDMFVESRTIVENESQELVEDTKILLKKYLLSCNFWLSLLFVFPVEIFGLALTSSYDIWMTITFLRSNRIFKVYKIFQLFNNMEKNITSNIRNIRMMKLLLLICSFTHLCACILYIQACYGHACTANSWVVAAGITKYSNSFDVYITSLYWAAATMTSTGYGDIYATTSLGEFIVLFVTITGLLLYGYCLSNIAATLTNKLAPKVEFMGRINAVVFFMLEQKLSPTLIERVDRYLGLVWRIHRGEAIPGAQLLMGDMPQRLQQDVSYEELNGIMSKVPIFKNTDTSFIKQLSTRLITYVFLPGDTIVYSGDVGREMYIMRRGLVEVLSKDKSFVVATLGTGGYFGEVGLIFGESRTADVRAKTYCEVAMLRKSDLDKVLVNFPLIERQLHTTGLNDNVLAKIRKAASDAGAPRKAQRIDLIEKTKNLRSKSVWRRASLKNQTVEESSINEELNYEFNAPYTQLHPVMYYLSKLLLRTSFDPHGAFFRGWTAFTISLSCVYFFTLGLEIAFLQEEVFIWAINYIFDLVFIIDIYLKFHLSFYNPEGVLVTHPTATAKNYVKTSFFLDFIACVPIDLIFFAAGNKVAFGYSKLNRMLHIIRVVQYFNYLNEPINGNTSLYRSLKFAAYMFLLTHLCACSWFILGCPYQGDIPLYIPFNNTQCTASSWAVENGRSLGSESFIHKYITSIYWAAATTCSVGYGDIHAYLVHEMGLSLLFMVIGVVFYGYIVASGAASLANADAQRARYQQKLNSINRFLKEQHVSTSLEKKVIGFYEFLWNRNKGVDLENLFQGLPISLQADITFSLYKDIIESVPLFQGTEQGFTKMLSLYIKPLLVPKGVYIVRKGDIGEEMFFIHKGIVEVVSEHEVPIIFDTMSSGRFFGEISTIFSCPRTASIRTQTNADVFVLTKKDLDVVLSHYPHIRKHIIETAEERQNMVQQRAAAFAAAKKKEEEQKRQEEELRLYRANVRRMSLRRFSEKNFHSDKRNSFRESITEETTAEIFDLGEEGDDEIIDYNCFQFISEYMIAKKLEFQESYKFTVHADSYFHLITTINCVLICFTYFTITYMATYQDHPLPLVIFNILALIMFYVEIFLKFHMVYRTTTGEEVTGLREIAKHYLHGEFAFDFVANFPLGLFCFVTSTNRMQVYSYLNLIHLLRLKRLRDSFRKYLKKLNINILLIRMMENVAQIMLTLQTLACIWYAVACPGNKCNHSSWVTERNRKSTVVHTPHMNYVDCMYWALATMTSTGYGDIHATNNIEKVFASITMVIGKLVFGYVLGNVASTMANVEVLRVKFEERFSAVQAHMRDQNVPLNLQERVVNFFQYIWKRNRGSNNDGLFHDLPQCLHGELCLELTGDALMQIPLFQNCELPFIRLLSTKTQLIQFHENEYITHKKDIGHELYFIKRGEVEMVADNEKTKVLKKGEYFGDRHLLETLPHRSFFRAKTHVDMFSLRDTDLQLAFQSFPEEGARVRENLRNFY